MKRLQIYARWENGKFKVTWEKLDNAKQYDVYLTSCGKKLKEKNLVKKVKDKKTTVILNGKSGIDLSSKKNYKVKVNAYTKIDGKKTCIGKSKICHVAGPDNKKYTNLKEITAEKKEITVLKGKKAQIHVKSKKDDNSKKYLSKRHGNELEYYTPNKTIAKVNVNGRIKAKKKGISYVYITAFNGKYYKVKIVVK